MQGKRAEIDTGVRSRDDDVRTLSKNPLHCRQHYEGWSAIDGERGNSLRTPKRYLRDGENLPILDLADRGTTATVRFQRRRHLDVVAISSQTARQDGQCRGANAVVVGNQDTQGATTLVRKRLAAPE